VVLTTPLLEGLDGVQKMSKSLGNAIGIDEPPLEMFGKVMSISDQMMWRYWELLTDTSMAGIEAMRQQVNSGQAHPMKVKQGLATKIVADFHGETAAKKAQEDWSRQFQKGEVPEDVETVKVALASVNAEEIGPDREEGSGFQVLDDLALLAAPPPGKRAVLFKADKLVARSGLAESNTDALRKIKQGAVQIDGVKIELPGAVEKLVPAEVVLRVGRRVKRVLIS
jgi:tyrosyl-tRNA synthetase